MTSLRNKPSCWKKLSCLENKWVRQTRKSLAHPTQLSNLKLPNKTKLHRKLSQALLKLRPKLRTRNRRARSELNYHSQYHLLTINLTYIPTYNVLQMPKTGILYPNQPVHKIQSFTSFSWILIDPADRLRIYEPGHGWVPYPYIDIDHYTYVKQISNGSILKTFLKC